MIIDMILLFCLKEDNQNYLSLVHPSVCVSVCVCARAWDQLSHRSVNNYDLCARCIIIMAHNQRTNSNIGIGIVCK
jgi:GTP cyclohydrolase FolE2